LDKTIEGYLTHLRAALAGADPALVQDALYDAEEYLRDAMADAGASDAAAAFDAAVDAYGTPEEVAAAYRDAELTVGAALRTPAPALALSENPFVRFFGIIADPHMWGSLFYMLLAFVTGIIYFTIVVTGVSLSLGMMILIIGVPIALLTLGIVRAVSFAEGRLVEGLLGVRMPRRPRIATGPSTDQRLISRIKSWLTDWRTWTSMLYMLLQLPLGIIYFTLIVVGVSVSAVTAAAPIVQTLTNHPIATTINYEYWIEPWSMPLFIAGGLLGLFVVMWVVKGIGHLHGLYAKALLVGRVDSGAEQVLAAPAPMPYAPPAAIAPPVPVAPAAPAPPSAPAAPVAPSGTDEGGAQ